MMTMNRDIAKGNFTQLKGKIKEQWGKLTDDEIDELEGKSEILAGKLQERYGLKREDAERQVKEFQDRNDWH
jgi:uncharacterized protein YjbJ (UPF0337 family)